MMNEQNEKTNEISLIDFWYIIVNHIWFIIITTIIFFSIITFYTWFIITPKYVSSADVMVQVEQDTSSTSELNYDFVNAFRLIDTVAELMEKEVVLTNTINRLNELGYSEITVKYLRDGLSVSSSSTSYFINISFYDENTEFAEKVVDSVIDSVIEVTDVQDAFPVLTNKIRRTSFANEAVYSSPNKILFSVLGLFSGLFISIGFVFTRELLSSHFKSQEEIEKTLNIQVLGVIPKMSSKEINRAKKAK